MATFQVVVSDPESGRSFQREVDGQDANRFIGREIGDEVDGEAVDLDGYTVEITGGSDAAGRPMRGDVNGAELKDIMLTGGTGFNPTDDGERKRVTVRGKEVSDATAQLNVAVAERGEESVASLYGEAEEETEEAEEEADDAEEEAEEEADDVEEETEDEADEAEEEAEDEADETEEEADDAEDETEEETEDEDDEAEAEDDEADAETAEA